MSTFLEGGIFLSKVVLKSTSLLLKTYIYCNLQRYAKVIGIISSSFLLISFHMLVTSLFFLLSSSSKSRDGRNEDKARCSLSLRNRVLKKFSWKRSFFNITKMPFPSVTCMTTQPQSFKFGYNLNYFPV